jgi:hypothetical protein
VREEAIETTVRQLARRGRASMRLPSVERAGDCVDPSSRRANARMDNCSGRADLNPLTRIFRPWYG